MSLTNHHKLFFTSFLFFFIFFYKDLCAAKPEIQLANLYSKNINLDEFLVSEKLDGVRGYFDGEKFISRQGNVIKAPRWFTENFPHEVLDGELWIGRGKFELVSKIIRQESPDDRLWEDVHFMIFDLPKSSEVFSKRYEIMQQLVAKADSKYLKVINQFEIKDHETLEKLLKSTVKNGGEGLMLHKKTALYKAERNDDLLKLKTFEDAEGKVIAHIAGKGKYAGKLGALLIEIETENHQKIHFKIGGGFSDQQRKNPPAIGSVITYKFFGKTKNGTPRFASFLRERIE